MAIPKTTKEQIFPDFSDRSCRTDNRKRKEDYYEDSFMGDYHLWIEHMGWDDSMGDYNHVPFDFLEEIKKEQFTDLRTRFRHFLIRNNTPEGYWDDLLETECPAEDSFWDEVMDKGYLPDEIKEYILELRMKK